MGSKRLKTFLKDEQAQDLIEYTLLLGFLALVSCGLMLQASNGVQGIWGSANSTLTQANSGSSVTPGGGGSGGSGSGDGGGGDPDHR